MLEYVAVHSNTSSETFSEIPKRVFLHLKSLPPIDLTVDYFLLPSSSSQSIVGLFGSLERTKTSITGRQSNWRYCSTNISTTTRKFPQTRTHFLAQVFPTCSYPVFETRRKGSLSRQDTRP
jgi:hypothetical protein